MEKVLALLMGMIMAFSQLFGFAGSSDYTKQGGAREALRAWTDKETVLATKYTGTPSDYTWDPDVPFTADDAVTLEKQPGKDFTILNLTDIHFSDYDYRFFLAFEATATMRRLVALTNPDLIIVTGDMVCDDSTYYSIHRFTDLMDSFGVPWAPVYGNHDDEGNCDKNYLADVMCSSPLCLMQKGDASMGVGNYVINITEKQEDGTSRITESLVLMDSHHGVINETQQAWYSWVADGIHRLSDGKAEISLWMHIPLPEYQLAYDAAWNSEKNCWYDDTSYGARNEKICCARDADGNPAPNGFFEKIKDSDAKYVFCGHEHMNDFSVMYEGVRLTYMMKVGFASGFQIGFNGGSVVTVGENGITRIQHRTTSLGVFMTIVDIQEDV